MKKIPKILLSVLICVCMIPCCPIPSAADGPTVLAKAYVLMDASTGETLLASNENQKLYPASVTKIMPLLLFGEALDSGKIKLTDKVTASPTAASKGGSQIWLKEGEAMTVEELLKATAIYSANDACTALGEYLAGSEEGFVKMLNDRAAELGMTQTHFDNCTGLDDDTDTHLTSAYDVALMSRELLKHKVILNYTTIWMDSLRDGATQLVNTNKLVRFYEGATGLKTGTTNKAGCCLSATAQRNGTHLIAVVMGCGNSNDRFNGAKALLNWGFANYSTLTPNIDQKSLAPVNVLKGVTRQILPQAPEPSPVLVPKGSEKNIEQKISLCVDVEAPVEKGQRLGGVQLYLGEKLLAEYPLTSPVAVERLTFGKVYKSLLSSICA
ncbi:MAG: D-alanyl-D-alanine carboxypeptidase [Clostridiales bacterium]|nr:D-alanyl-D-alanine carboxypeptidase [Clostridiales bacterium]